jgi:hypothetical protein
MANEGERVGLTSLNHDLKYPDRNISHIRNGYLTAILFEISKLSDLCRTSIAPHECIRYYENGGSITGRLDSAMLSKRP